MKTPFSAPESFQSGDLTLRAPRLADAAAVREAALSSYAHLRPWMPWAMPDEPLVAADERNRRFVAAYLAQEDFLVRAWIGDEMVGSTGFHLRWGPLAWGVAEIGMWVRASRAGSGVGTRMLGAMLDWGFGEWGWERLCWTCQRENVASARVAERNGMAREATLRSAMVDVDGVRRDGLLYAKLREEHLG